MTQSAWRRSGMLSARALSGYARVVSSGASTAAAGLRSAGASIVSSIAGRDGNAAGEKVNWAAFDKLELDSGVLRQVLLLAYTSGFQVWDVEQADNVRQLECRHDWPASLMQVLKTPIPSKRKEDLFANARPILVVASGETFGRKEIYSEVGNYDPGVESFPSLLCFFSLQAHDYVHELKFRSPVFSIRCSPRVLAVSQASQIHCFDAATLEREYTFLTNPIPLEVSGSGDTGYGPLALGPRWLAYSGSPVVVPGTARVGPQLLGVAAGILSTLDKGMVAHYAKESSRQLAASIATLGDMGYKKLMKYCSEIMPNGNGTHGTQKLGNLGLRAGNGAANVHVNENEFAGMVIVRDIVSKIVIAQFKAHTSPISSLCFDPSGTLLVTVSIHGCNINVFRIMPGPNQTSSEYGVEGSFVHLFRLQRGMTNAVIKDISFSDDSEWIMISSSRGTSHLFAISPYSGAPDCHYNDIRTYARPTMSSSLCKKMLLTSGTPVTLSVVSRIRNGSGLLQGAVSGAAAFATGAPNPITGAIASAFHNSRGTGPYSDTNSMSMKSHLLVFSPSASIIQYVLHRSSEAEDLQVPGYPHGLPKESDTSFVVEAVQKWDVCGRRNRKDHVETVDFVGYANKEDDVNVPSFKTGPKMAASSVPSLDRSIAKNKLGLDESHRYISGSELQTNVVRDPLWSRSGVSFQVMVPEPFVSSGDPVCGECEVEVIPSYIIEPRSKDLIPVYDPSQALRNQQASRHGMLRHQKSATSECSGAVDCVSDGAVHSDVSGLGTTAIVQAAEKPFDEDGGASLAMRAQLGLVDTESNCGDDAGSHLD